MTLRMYKSSLFEEIRRTADTVEGYVLDNHTGKRVGRKISVPIAAIRLTGDDQMCADIAKMDEGALLDFVLTNISYLSDPYYRAFATAVADRHAALRAPAAPSQSPSSGCTLGQVLAVADAAYAENHRADLIKTIMRRTKKTDTDLQNIAWAVAAGMHHASVRDAVASLLAQGPSTDG